VANTALQLFSIIFVFITIFLVYLARLFQARRKHSPLRPIEGFNDIPIWVGQAIESNRPLHLSLGSAGVGDNSTIVALAGAELFYYVVQEATIGDVSPIISTTSTAAIPLGQDTLRRAYQSRGHSNRYQASKARWYPEGQRSMAFAAALTGMMKVEKPTAHIFAGSFGPELALVLDAAHHQNQSTFAVSDQIEGQAIAFALAENYLIGEELFAAPAYVSDNSADKAETVVVDLWRGLLILGLCLLIVLNILQQLNVASPYFELMLAGVVALFIIGLIVNLRR